MTQEKKGLTATEKTFYADIHSIAWSLRQIRDELTKLNGNAVILVEGQTVETMDAEKEDEE